VQHYEEQQGDQGERKGEAGAADGKEKKDAPDL